MYGMSISQGTLETLANSVEGNKFGMLLRIEFILIKHLV